MMVRSDITKRNFTKRQQNILMFICNYSFTFGKESAIIPQLQDFEVCGISKTKVREELEKLLEMNVIKWDRESNRFSVIDPNDWSAPFHSGYKDMRTQEIFIVNSRDAGISLSKIIKNATLAREEKE